MDRTWVLSLETQPFWTVLPPGAISAGARYDHTAVYEPDLDLILVIGGEVWVDGAYDTRRLDCAGGWWLQAGGIHGTVTASPPKTCYDDGEMVTLQAVGEPDYGLQQWLGDASGASPLIDVTMDGNKTIFAQFHTDPVSVEEKPLVFALDVRPNPSAGFANVSYALPREARVRLTVFDVAGREVTRLVDGVRPAGRHVASWVASAGGGAIRPGIYLVRYETPAGAWTRRLAVLR